MIDTAILAAVLAGVAVFFGLLAVFPGEPPAADVPGLGERLGSWWAGRLKAAGDLVGQARLELDPRALVAIAAAAPLLLGLVGLLVSPVLGLVGAAAGLAAPRLYLRYLVAGEARAADDDAPRVLRAMVNRAAAGGTYPDLLTAAADAARHRWVRADFAEVAGLYYANEALPVALGSVRARQASRNLRLVYDALIVAADTNQPASAAGEVLAAIGEAARANRQIARQAIAESRGLRLQAAILAVVIPGLYVYLSITNPELTAPVTETALGQLVLLPAAVGLEIAGIVLSWRVTRLEV